LPLASPSTESSTTLQSLTSPIPSGFGRLFLVVRPRESLDKLGGSSELGFLSLPAGSNLNLSVFSNQSIGFSGVLATFCRRSCLTSSTSWPYPGGTASDFFNPSLQIVKNTSYFPLDLYNLEVQYSASPLQTKDRVRLSAVRALFLAERPPGAASNRYCRLVGSSFAGAIKVSPRVPRMRWE